MENRRRRTRVDFNASVDVHAGEVHLVGLKTKDLSHKGVFVLGKPSLKEGQGCLVVLHLDLSEDKSLDLHMEGRIARITSQGVAIDFISMDPDTFLHLRNLVLLNAPDPESAEREFTVPAFDSHGVKGPTGL